MRMTIEMRAGIHDLYAVPENGKAELVTGGLLLMSPTGAMPGRAATKIASSLMRHEEEQGGGYAFGDNVGFVVSLPERESFSPDAAWYVGDVQSMKFLQGAPLFAVEVRSENDYRPAAQQAIEQKISDYFAAGALVVWDVDLQSDVVIKKFMVERLEAPVLFRRGEVADAEPAVPGWRFAVDVLFR